jgi:sugar/nucleoside kinase (ribokinase family)
VDTIGAGDTLIASVIASLSHDVALEIALQKACRVAGNKVGQVGFAGLKKYFRI